MDILLIRKLFVCYKAIARMQEGNERITIVVCCSGNDFHKAPL